MHSVAPKKREKCTAAKKAVSRGNMNNDCETCKALWQEYARATHAHIAVGSKLDVAKLRHENDVIQRLLPEVQAAADYRTLSLSDLAKHEQQAHDGTNVRGVQAEGR